MAKARYCNQRTERRVPPPWGGGDWRSVIGQGQRTSIRFPDVCGAAAGRLNRRHYITPLSPQSEGLRTHKSVSGAPDLRRRCRRFHGTSATLVVATAALEVPWPVGRSGWAAGCCCCDLLLLLASAERITFPLCNGNLDSDAEMLE